MAPLHKAQQQQQQQSEQAHKFYHFTHPNHPLQQVCIAQEYNCDGCNTLGYGTRFRCESCDFDLHDHCASCPFTVSSYLHPQHHLNLVNLVGKAHFCDVCGDLASGIFYTCGACDFDVHPLCTQLPVNYQHALHPQHVLTLQPSNSNFAPSACGLCGHAIAFWSYRCTVCCVDVHLECAGAPPEVFAFAGAGAGASVQPQAYAGAQPQVYTVDHGVPMTWVPPVANGYAVGVPGPISVYENKKIVTERNRRKIYSVLGTLAVKAVVCSIIGVPLSL
ncbi:hypothetical protein LguiA_034912 [Lonicera macranthoides]